VVNLLLLVQLLLLVVVWMMGLVLAWGSRAGM
jgi:hypothetical protein